jgi:hypothetical protein
MGENNLKKLAEEYNPPESLKRRVRHKVNSNLGVMRFIGNVFDLYLGQAGRVVTEMLGSFEPKKEDKEQYADSDNKELPLNESSLPEKTDIV